MSGVRWPTPLRLGSTLPSLAGGGGSGLARPYLLLVPFILAACSSPSEPPPEAKGDENIACAIGGSAELRQVCSAEWLVKDGRQSLIVRHPDGAFRRFDLRPDGSGLAAADGAEPAQSVLRDGKFDVTVGADRYLVPLAVKPDAGG